MKEYLYHYVIVTNEQDKTKYADFFKAETDETAGEFMNYLLENLKFDDGSGELRKANITDAWYEKVETVKWKGKEHEVVLVPQFEEETEVVIEDEE